jgi:hypothetical protein
MWTVDNASDGMSYDPYLPSHDGHLFLKGALIKTLVMLHTQITIYKDCQ